MPSHIAGGHRASRRPGAAVLAKRVALALTSCAASVALAQGELSMLCSAPLAWCEALSTAFARDTGIQVKFAQRDAGQTLAQLASERTDPRHDLWFGGGADLHFQAAETGLTDEYRSPKLPELRDWAAREAELAKWRTVGVHAAVLGIGYNADALAKKRLHEPKCWVDLARSEYDGEIRFADPRLSSAGFATLATFVQIFGEDRGLDLLRSIAAHAGAPPARTNTGPVRATSRGEATIAITFLQDAATEIAGGFPIRIVAPCEGTGFEPVSMSVVRGAPNAANARRFYDWALMPQAQRLGALTRHFEMPASRDTPPPPFGPRYDDVKLIAWDFVRFGSASERRRLLDRWDGPHDVPR